MSNRVKYFDETLNITHINEKQLKKNSNKKNNEVRLDLSIDDVSNVLGFNISELKKESLSPQFIKSKSHRHFVGSCFF